MQSRKLLRVAARTIIGLLTIAFVGISPTYADPGDETLYYLLTDHLGSVDVVLDDQGNVVERRDYLPYGQERVAGEEAGAPETDYGFTGKELDSETNLYYYGARYFDPLIGRFVSRDPVEGDLKNPQTLNRYSYALNDPLIFTDPTGMYIMKTGEVEKGDTLGGITGKLNKYFGTNLSYHDLAAVNHVSDPDKIRIGQTIKMGTVNSDGSVWQRSYNADKVTIGYFSDLNEKQKKITHYGRNLFQGDLPLALDGLDTDNWENYGATATHNLGSAYGNTDYRGLGSRSGQQAIYGLNRRLIDSPENMGTYDFFSPNVSKLDHRSVDVIPWIEWGNSPQDTTTMQQRKDAYYQVIKDKIISYFDF